MPIIHDMEQPYLPKRTRCFRSYFESDSEILDILLEFYPDKILTTKDITNDYSQLYCNITRLVKRNYLQKMDNQHFAPRYKITMHGRFQILCYKLRVSFLCLCILSEAYALSKNQITNGCDPSYPLHDAMDVFEGLITEKTIRNMGCKLCSKGFMTRMSNDIVQIKKATLKKLDRHSECLKELHEWVAGVPNHLGRTVADDLYGLGQINNAN